MFLFFTHTNKVKPSLQTRLRLYACQAMLCPLPMLSYYVHIPRKVWAILAFGGLPRGQEALGGRPASSENSQVILCHLMNMPHLKGT